LKVCSRRPSATSAASTAGIAFDGLRFVVAIREDGIDTERAGVLGDHVASASVEYGESAAARFERRLQLGDGVPDEFDATVGAARQRIEDPGIEDEHAEDGARIAERVVQRGVVVGPEIAAEPDEGAVEGFHGFQFRAGAAGRLRVRCGRRFARRLRGPDECSRPLTRDSA
jgi:hypothetical protein